MGVLGTFSRDVVLIVDDDEVLRRMLQLLLSRDGYEVITAEDGEAALALTRTCEPRVAILDYRLPDMTGIDLLRRIKVANPHVSAIMLTGFANLPGAVDAVKAGAFDYLPKPFDNQDLLAKVRAALSCQPHPALALDAPGGLRARMGPSPAIAQTIADIERVAPTDFSATLCGETGAGKELVARAIHELSLRKSHPFVAVDCGSIHETLIENELFGHERGAFTGADRQQPGKFEAAEGGTLFLDEIANLSWSAQARLLRVLQERVVCRVGGTKSIPIDVRLIAASNQDLTVAVAKGTFREDLLYRLGDFLIVIPPLRDRREDIMHIAEQILIETNQDLGKQVQGFTPGATKAMLAYCWPGNVRQLRSVVRRGALMATDIIDTHHLTLPDTGTDAADASDAFGPNGLPAGMSLKEFVRLRTADVERQVLFDALQRSNGNKAAVARLLQVDYKTVHTKLKTYGLGT